MLLHELRVRSFRNIEEASVSFSPGVNLLFGKNGEGKTNLLEAVYYFARGKSFRGAKDSELCRFGDGFYEIEASFLGGGREQTLFYRYAGGEKKKKRNGAPVDSAAEMIGHMRAVLFHPEHLLLVKGSPSVRREFLNIAISQLDPSYLSLYATYQRILDERNALLRFGQKGIFFESEEMEVWSRRLADAAARVALSRYRYVRELAPFAEELLSNISLGRETLSLSYRCEVEEESVPLMSERYATLLMSDIRRELAAGHTLFGPHHDELLLSLSGHPAREFASQGQQRSLTLALKLAEGEVARSRTGEYPIFLFDDVMSELDEGRRRFLFSSLEGRQIIVTACDRRDFEGGDCHLIKTEGGSYEAASR